MDCDCDECRGLEAEFCWLSPWHWLSLGVFFLGLFMLVMVIKCFQP
jgi:hypothetical protein